MTQRLKELCPQNFSLSVLGEEWCEPDYSEQQLLELSDHQQVLLSELRGRVVHEEIPMPVRPSSEIDAARRPGPGRALLVASNN